MRWTPGKYELVINLKAAKALKLEISTSDARARPGDRMILAARASHAGTAPNGGVADSLDEAKEAFRAAGEAGG